MAACARATRRLLARLGPAAARAGWNMSTLRVAVPQPPPGGFHPNHFHLFAPPPWQCGTPKAKGHTAVVASLIARRPHSAPARVMASGYTPEQACLDAKMLEELEQLQALERQECAKRG